MPHRRVAFFNGLPALKPTAYAGSLQEPRRSALAAGDLFSDPHIAKDDDTRIAPAVQGKYGETSEKPLCYEGNVENALEMIEDERLRQGGHCPPTDFPKLVASAAIT